MVSSKSRRDFLDDAKHLRRLSGKLWDKARVTTKSKKTSKVTPVRRVISKHVYNVALASIVTTMRNETAAELRQLGVSVSSDDHDSTAFAMSVSDGAQRALEAFLASYTHEAFVRAKSCNNALGRRARPSSGVIDLAFQTTNRAVFEPTLPATRSVGLREVKREIKLSTKRHRVKESIVSHPEAEDKSEEAVETVESSTEKVD